MDRRWTLQPELPSPRHTPEAALLGEFFENPSELTVVWLTSDHSELAACLVSVPNQRIAAHLIYESGEEGAELLETQVMGSGF